MRATAVVRKPKVKGMRYPVLAPWLRNRAVVTVTDHDGIRHEVEVRPESLYEAAVIALTAFRADDWTHHVGAATRLHVEAR